MNLLILFLFARAAHSSTIADIISSYAKVAINNSTQRNFTAVIQPLNSTDEDDSPVDYEDFDDTTEVRGPTSDMLKYINGFVNLLALMYKFSGSRGQPRSVDMAEDRYHPQTETKRFKYEGYPPVKSAAYNPGPSNGAETYSNEGKTSYDADVSQSAGKNPMKDYMNQNDVDIHQSYSYEIPQKEEKGESHDPPAPVYYPWMSKSTTSKPKDETWGDMRIMNKPSFQDTHEESIESYPWMMSKPHHESVAEKPIESYPWMMSKPHDESVPEKPIESYPWMTHDVKEPYGMKPPKSQMPPPEDDHVYPYPYLHDEEHDDAQDEEHDVKDEDRESKRPYTYYHLGRKLWYIPLLFSLYFIVYVAALILKSVARHKVQFPEKLWDLNHDHHDHHHHSDHSRRGRKLEEVTDSVFNGIEKISVKYNM